MELLPYIIIAIVGLIAGIFSGITGGGGAIIMIPAFILSGLPPQMAVATAKMSGLGAAFGGLSAFFKSGHIRKDILKVMIPIAVVIGLITPFIFAAIESRSFQIALALVMIAMLPTLFIKKKSLKPPTRKHKFFGYSLYTAVLFFKEFLWWYRQPSSLCLNTATWCILILKSMATRRAIVVVMGPIVHS